MEALLVTQKLMGHGSQIAMKLGFRHQISIFSQNGCRSNDPVTGTFQFGCIKRQIRSIEATNVRMINLRLIIYPSIGRLQNPRLWSSSHQENNGMELEP